MGRWLSIVLAGLGGLAMVACGADGSGPRSAGTGGSGGSGGVVLSCQSLDPPPDDCDLACSSDRDCEASFCENGRCVAHCTATQGCGAGWTCNTSNGRCIPDMGTGGTAGTGNSGGNGCQSVTITPTRSIPNIMFLVDQSGSMPADFGGGLNRWEAAHAAITEIVAETDSIVRYGLTTYQSADGGETPAQCPIFDTQVNFSMDASASINMSYPATFPGGEDTPTGDAIDVLVDIIQADPPPAEGPTIIVLATDGEPDSCETPDPNPTAQARDEAVSASARARSLGIDVLVLWVGALSDADTQDHMKEVANVGVGLGQFTGVPAPVGEEPANPAQGAPFWVGTNPQDLEDEFRTIIGSSISCDIQMDKRFDDKVKACAEGDVRLNGVPLSCPSEWRVKPGVDDVIELVGSACDTFKSGEVTFTAEFPCGAIIVE